MTRKPGTLKNFHLFDQWSITFVLVTACAAFLTSACARKDAEFEAQLAKVKPVLAPTPPPVSEKPVLSTTPPPMSEKPVLSTTPSPMSEKAPPGSTLVSRMVINPPAFGHPPVSQAAIAAAKQAIAALPAPLRAKLDASKARVILSPNMIDRWPDSVKDLPEDNPAPTLAELPGRIYDLDMCVYERPKKRGTTALKAARAPSNIRLQVGNMCFQLLDDMAGGQFASMTISKDPALRKEWQADKATIPLSMVPQLATFMKTDDWGPRETCSELFGSMLGGHDECTDNLYRYFPRTKKWLAAKMGVAGQ